MYRDSSMSFQKHNFLMLFGANGCYTSLNNVRTKAGVIHGLLLTKQ